MRVDRLFLVVTTFLACGRLEALSDSGAVGEVGFDAGPVGSDGGADGGWDDVDAGDPCGPDGVFHINHCDCNPGFREVAGLRCEPVPACTPDEHEPNNSLASASQSDGGVFSGRICAGDLDHLLVPAPQGVQLNIELKYLRQQGNLDLRLYEPGRDPRFSSPVGEGDSDDDDETVSHVTRTAGNFLVRIYGSPSTEQAAYQLHISFTP